MSSIFTNKNGTMIPDSLQPLTDRIGIGITGIAAYMNIKIGFEGATFNNLILSPFFNSLLVIIISLLSIFYLFMRIYDQYITTKLKKDAMVGDSIPRKRFKFFNRKNNG